MTQNVPEREPTNPATVQSAAWDAGPAWPWPAMQGLIGPRYLVALVLGMGIWAGLLLAFIWIIDPYGVSPMHVTIAGINKIKLKRVNIDRIIKPYEVWRYQPRTIFMGTSRINESFDPAVLDGTPFAPAYNAAIPANEINEVYADLDQYLKFDSNLRVMFLEVFFYNFSRPVAAVHHRDFGRFIWDATALMFSETALSDATLTIGYNSVAGANVIPAHTTPRGFWVPTTWFNTADTFNSKVFIETIIRIHANIPDLQVQPTAFAALDHIVELCARHQVELHLIITPNYPWDDYRLVSLGYWSRVEDFYRRLSHYSNVVSFAQYNTPVTEPAGPGMRFWYDPIHFSVTTGRMMLRALIGTQDPERPENFMRPITPETVEAALAERRNGLERWVAANREFAEQFDRARDAAYEKRVTLPAPALSSVSPPPSANPK